MADARSTEGLALYKTTTDGVELWVLFSLWRYGSCQARDSVFPCLHVIPCGYVIPCLHPTAQNLRRDIETPRSDCRARSLARALRMEPTRLTIDIPAIPLTEALLGLIACLLLRACSLLSEIARSNKQLAERSEVHTGAAAARQRRPTPQPLAEGRAGSSSPTPERLRPIMVSAEAFEKCLLGDDDDVQVPLFMAACKCYCNVLNVIGPFTLLTVREVHANMVKIDTSLQLDAVAYCSMRALLTAEVDAGMHQALAQAMAPTLALAL